VGIEEHLAKTHHRVLPSPESIPDGGTQQVAYLYDYDGHPVRDLPTHMDDLTSHGPYWPAVYSDVTFARAVVALRFDDGDIDDYTTTYPLLRDRHLVGLFAIQYWNLGLSGQATLAQLLDGDSLSFEDSRSEP
jgi:hypothetical protein